MIQVSVTLPSARIEIIVSAAVKNRRGLNAALASRLVDVLRDHFHQKNALPNKLKAPKTNFWNKIAQATQVLSFSDAGATIAIADQRANIHIHGGRIVAKAAGALTIPLIPEAHGLFARSYELATGRDLFILRSTDENKAFLAEETSTGIRRVYVLKKSVNIEKDPTALPTPDTIQAALIEEASDFIQRQTQLS